MRNLIDTEHLTKQALLIVEKAVASGADAADAVVASGRSKSISVRLGKVEATDASEGDAFSLRVFVGKKIATISANSDSDPTQLVERAIAMAKVSPEDDFACLADPADLTREFMDMQCIDETDVSSEELVEKALEAEDAALSVKGVSNSMGAGASSGISGVVLATSHGFVGSHMSTGYSLSVSAIAGEGTKMERDYDYDSRIFYDELNSAKMIGKSAGERAFARINPRMMPTQSNLTVVFDPRVARGFVGHLASAINGASVARKTSFLKDMMGEQILSKGLNIVDDPLIIKGPASRPFDGEGVTGKRLVMVEDGVLAHWLLSTGTARELGLKTNGRGARAGSNVNPSSSNFSLEPGSISPDDLIRQIGTGFYVTELIGHGVDMVSGEYSRGASGFWIENGEIAFPVSEVTIASNLKDMFKRITLANDIDRKYSVASPTLSIEGMTLAGK